MPSKEYPDVVYEGVHDIFSDDKSSSPVLKNLGDTVYNREPGKSPHRRPFLARQGEAKRSTTTSDPAKKTAKAATKDGGAGPES